ncbi:hypothetical protein [Thalassobacillus hwangdonensis]|uniref:Uncharacterized protein n=1 Tax=Thalassobacillus hwangdonensis TaxID=546108 RepID=A0ABW3L0Q2_9BACI
MPNHTIEEVAGHVFELLKEKIDLNTFFIASNDGQEVDVVKAFNREEVLLEEGFNIDFQESY